VIYVRYTQSIFDGLEAVGGFIESLMHIGTISVFFFQVRLFKSSFLRQLYQVKAVLKPNTKRFDDEKMV
jgi:hypothetical protein